MIFLIISLFSLSGPDPKPIVKGDTRTFRVWLDTNQYQQDMERVVRGEEVSVCVSFLTSCCALGRI